MSTAYGKLTGKQSANKSLGAKLALRRHFLATYHAGTVPIVFDACQGEGVLWTRLRAEYPCTYWGVDRKAERGRLTLDSTRILAQPGWTFDVIDIDTYGSPWAHWTALLPHVTKPTTVFLTFGGGGPELRDPGNQIFGAMGITGALLERVPNAIRWRLADWALDGSVLDSVVTDWKAALKRR